MRRPVSTALFGFALYAASMSHATAAGGAAFFEQDAFMACDNTGTCRIAAFGPLAPLMLGMLIERAAGPQTAVTARIAMAEGAEDAPPPRSATVGGPQGTLRLRAKGKDLGEIGRMESQGEDLALPDRHVPALIEALAAGDRVEVVDGMGQAWPLSERGAGPLLLKMDEVQGRLHTPGALVRKGAQPESKVPSAVPAPSLEAPPLLVETREDDGLLAERADLRQLLQPVADAKDACIQASSRRLRVERVDASHVLAVLSCATERYIVPAGTWLVRDRPPFSPTLVSGAALFPLPPHAVFVEEGVATGTDTCGRTRHWAWDGARLVMSAEFVGADCVGPSHRHWQLPTYLGRMD